MHNARQKYISEFNQNEHLFTSEKHTLKVVSPKWNKHLFY